MLDQSRKQRRIEFQQLILEKETLDATDRQLLQQLSATRIEKRGFCHYIKY